MYQLNLNGVDQPKKEAVEVMRKRGMEKSAFDRASAGPPGDDGNVTGAGAALAPVWCVSRTRARGVFELSAGRQRSQPAMDSSREGGI